MPAALTMPTELASRPRRMTIEGAYEAHHRRIYGLGLRYGGGRRGWAEDLVQDTFLRLLQHLDDLKDPDDLGGWLYTVANNLCVARLRREQSLVARLLRFGAAAPTQTPSAEEWFEQRQDAAAAMATLQTLPARERVVLGMKLLDGKSQKEIAATLSLSKGYVSKLLNRAWSQVRQAGWELDDDQA